MHTINLERLRSTVLRADRELQNLRNKNAPIVSRDRKVRNKRAGQEEYQQWYWLIDYRKDNKRLLKRALTRSQAAKKNEFLKDTGKAWAMVGR